MERRGNQILRAKDLIWCHDLTVSTYILFRKPSLVLFKSIFLMHSTSLMSFLTNVCGPWWISMRKPSIWPYFSRLTLNWGGVIDSIFDWRGWYLFPLLCSNILLVTCLRNALKNLRRIISGFNFTTTISPLRATMFKQTISVGNRQSGLQLVFRPKSPVNVLMHVRTNQ